MYRYEIADSGEALAVTCVLTHTDGHSERTTMTAGADTSGSKNAIQARGSAVSYLERYTLCGALGLLTVDEDSDGGVGTVSDDSNDATDPSIGVGRVVVTKSASGGQTTVSSVGRSGDASRKIEAVTEAE